jgi:hypothetical protein
VYIRTHTHTHTHARPFVVLSTYLVRQFGRSHHTHTHTYTHTHTAWLQLSQAYFVDSQPICSSNTVRKQDMRLNILALCIGLYSVLGRVTPDSRAALTRPSSGGYKPFRDGDTDPHPVVATRSVDRDRNRRDDTKIRIRGGAVVSGKKVTFMCGLRRTCSCRWLPQFCHLLIDIPRVLVRSVPACYL